MNLSYKKIFFYAKALLMIIILWMLYRHAQLKLDLLYSLFDSPFSMLSIIFLCYLMVIAHAWRWYRLNLAQGISLSFFCTIMPTYLGIAFNNVLPGSVGGDFIRLYYAFKKFPERKTGVVLSILVDRMSGLMGIFVIASIIAPYYLGVFRHNSALFYLLVACITVSISMIGLFIVLVLLLSEKVGFALWLETKLQQNFFSKSFLSLFQAINIYKNSKLIILESVLVSMGTQFLLLIVVVMLSRMMGLPLLSLFDYLIALVIAQVANLIPLTPGGIGVGEAAFANIIFLLNPGVSAAYATVFLALRLLSTAAYLPGVAIGIFGFSYHIKTDSKTLIT